MTYREASVGIRGGPLCGPRLRRLRRRRESACVPEPAFRLAGFTLVEVLIALTLLALMAGISVPYLFREQPETTVRRAADELANSIQQARFRAVGMKRDVHFHFEPAGTQAFYTAYASTGDPGDPPPTGTNEEVAATRIEFPDVQAARRGRSLPEGLAFDKGTAASPPEESGTIVALQLPDNPLIFNSRGFVEWPENDESVWAFVYVAHTDRPEVVRAVGISRMGTVRVWVLRGGQWQ